MSNVILSKSGLCFWCVGIRYIVCGRIFFLVFFMLIYDQFANILHQNNVLNHNLVQKLLDYGAALFVHYLTLFCGVCWVSVLMLCYVFLQSRHE